MGFLLSKNNGAMRRTELGHADARSLILKTESEIPEAWSKKDTGSYFANKSIQNSKL